MAITVVTGPPCSGKTHHVRRNAKPGAIIIDLDAIAAAMTTTDVAHHDYPKHVRDVAIEARATAIRMALERHAEQDVWIIHTQPSRLQRDQYLDAGAKVITIDPGIDVCLARAQADRPERMVQVIHDWYAKRDVLDEQRTKRRKMDPGRDGTAGQLGNARWQKLRASMLREWRLDEAPCWVCKQPIDYDLPGNTPQGPSVDHIIERADGGDVWDRDNLAPAHMACNSRRSNVGPKRSRLAGEVPAAPARQGSRRWLGA